MNVAGGYLQTSGETHVDGTLASTGLMDIAGGLVSGNGLIVGNIIAIMAVWRALGIHSRGGPNRWDKTRHIFPVEETAA